MKSSQDCSEARRFGKTREFWSAPAERSDDGAMDRLPTALETPNACAPGPRNPKRRGASLPAALQNGRRLTLVAIMVAQVGPMVVSLPAVDIVVTNNFALEPGATLKSRLIVRASHLTIEGNGATLQGPGIAGDLKSLEDAGVGVLIEGCVNVTIRNLKAQGFATGLLARDSQAL